MNDAVNQAVTLEISNGIARITLNRPDRLNAFDSDMANAWAEAAHTAVTTPDAGVVLVQANGRAFSAGGDVRSMAELDDLPSEIKRLAQRINDGIISLIESDRPVVAAAHGVTAGGGLGILLSSDYAVIGRSSRVGSLYANVGLTPDLSVSALLARAVGERRALQLTLQEQMLSADETREWGIAAEVVDDDEVRSRAEAIAQHWVDNATWAYGQAKRLIRTQPTRSFREQLAEEAQTISNAAATDEATRRIRAFARGS